MRIWQYYAVKELTNYGLSDMEIADTTGLTTVAVASIQGGAEIPSVILLHSDTSIARCPKCNSLVQYPCYTCCLEEYGDQTPIEVVLRPKTHQHYMLNVHLLQKDEDSE